MTYKNAGEKHSDDNGALLSSLESAGLTQNEAIIYLHLLQVGKEVGATKIAVATGIHRQYVHVTLQKLLGLGLVVSLRNGERSKYRAAPPRAFERFARNKFEMASKTTQELATISALGNEQDVEIIQGELAIQIYELNRLRNAPLGTIQYFIGGASSKFFQVMGDVYQEEYAPEANRREIGTKYLGSAEEVAPMSESQRIQERTEFRILENLPEGVVNVMIMNDTLSFYTFVTPPILYVIHSGMVAKSYLNFFDVLWKLGKNIRDES